MTVSTLPTATPTLQIGIRQRSLRRHCRMGRATELVFVLATGATLVLSGSATEAQTWDGDTNGLWSVATNWSGNALPTAGQTVTINGAGGLNQPTVDTAQTVAQTNVSAGTLTVASTLSSPVTVTDTGNLVINLGANVIGNVVAAGTTTTNNGTITGALFVNDGTVNNNGTVTGATTVAGETLNLAGATNLSDTAALTVNSGTVNVDVSDTVGNLAGLGGTISIDAGQALTAGGNNASSSYGGEITGDGTLQKTGTGTLTLAGASDVAVVSISNGTVAVTGSGTLAGDVNGGATGILSTDGGALSDSTDLTGDLTLEITGDETVGNLFGFFGDIEVDNTANLTLATGTYDIGGTITGDGGIIVDGATVQYTGSAKAYTGETSVVSGGSTLSAGIASTDVDVSGGSLTATGGALAAGTTLDISGSGTVNIDDGDTIASVTQTGGTLEGDSTLAVTGTLGQNGGEIGAGVTVNVAGAKTLDGGSIAGTLGGGGLTRVQTGTTTLTGTLTGGGVTVSGGTLNVDGGSLGTDLTLSGGTLTASGDSTLSPPNLNLAAATANTISAADGQTLNLTPTALQFGANTLTTFGSATEGGPVILAPTLTAIISTNSDVTVAGGTLQLGGLNILTSGGGALPDRNVTVETGATLDLAGRSHAVANLAGDGTITNSGPAAAVLTLESNLDSEISGVIEGGTGGIAVTKSLGGTTTLSGANTYTGLTTVAAGTLALEGGAAIANTGGVQINAGATLESVTDDETVGRLSVALGGTLDVGSTLFTTFSGTDSTLSGTLLGAAGSGMFKDGAGVFNFAGDGSGFDGTLGTAAGEIVLVAGSTVNANTVGAIAGATFTTEGGALTHVDVGVISDGTINFNGDETIAFLTNNSFNGPGTGTININDLGTILMLTGGTLDSAHSGAINGEGGLEIAGGTHRLTGDITLDGGVDVDTGSTLVLGGNNSFGDVILVSGTLRLESNAAAGGATGQIVTLGSVVDYADGVISATPIEIASDTTQVQVLTGAAEQSGAITEDAAGRPLEKIGAGELLLSGNNSFTGDLTITGGTLAVTGGAALDDSVEVVVGTGTEFRLDSDEDIGALTSAAADAAVDVGSNDLTILGSQNTTYAGTLAGSGALLNDGTGLLALTGNGAAFTGLLGSVGTGSTVALTGAGTTNATGVGATLGNTFTTDGSALLASNVIVSADGQVTFTGSETVGALVNSSASGVANGTVTLTGATTILTVNGSANAVNPLNFNGTNGTIGGTGTLNVTGGTFAVGQTGTVQTATTIGAGGTVTNSGTMAAVSNAGTFTNTFNAVSGATAGAVTNTGAGTGSNAGTIASLTHSSSALFTNTNVITGNVAVNSGTVTLSGTSNIGNGSTVTVTSGILNAGVADTIGELVANGGTTNVTASLVMGELSGTAGSIVTTGGALFVGDSDAVNSSFGGVISGTGTLEKVGTDTLTLTGANTLSGGVTVTGGTLALTGGGGLANGTVTINPAGSLTTDGSAFGIGVTIANNGLPAAVAAPFGLMLTGGGDESIAAMGGNGTTNLSSGSVLTLNSLTSNISGVISGAGGLTVAGSSITNLTGVNTYTGDTQVNAGGALNLVGAGSIASGVVSIAGVGALTTDGDGLSDTAAVTVGAGNGVFRVDGTETIGSLTQIGGFVNGTSTLTTTSFDQTGGTTSGTVTVATGSFTQNGGTIGTGTTVTQTGGALMSGGSVAGTLTGAGVVTVNAGTTTVTGTIGSTDVRVLSGELSLDGGEGLTTATDLMVQTGAFVDVNIDEAIATLSGTGGSVDVDAANSLTLGEATLDTATYSGAVTGGGDLAKTGTNTQVLAGANTLSGAVDVTGGTLRITGSIAATDLETGASGTLETDGGALVNTTTVTNAGTLRITAGTETIAAVNGAGGIDLNTGGLTLAGASSTISGAITGSGTLTVNAAADGDATGGAVVELSGDSNAYTGTSEVTEGTLRVTATGTLGGPVNVATLGQFELDGGTLGGALVNTGGVVEAEGTMQGNLTNQNVGAGGGADEGTFATTGDLTFSPAGTLSFTNSGTATIALGDVLGLSAYTNQTGGITSVTSGRTLQATTVTNASGALMVVDGATIDGNVVNGGRLNVNGTSTVTGDLTNNSVVDMADGTTGDVLNVGGSVSGTGTYEVDLNLSNGTSDRVSAGLATTSAVNLDFSITGNGYIGSAITLFSGAAPGAALTGETQLPVGGSIIYTLGQTGSNVEVYSQVNPAVGGVAASASMTQSLIGTIVNRPTSPFVSGLAAEEGCSQGGYLRATGGKATVSGASSSNGFTTNSTLASDFYGVQGGYDVGCFDGRFFDGWDGAAGLMLGYNAGSTDQSLFSDPTQPGVVTGLLGTEFSQNYIGLYVAGAKDRMSADFQLRYDDTSFDLSETTLIGLPVGLDGLSYSTKATTVGTRFNYRFDLDEEKGINLVPTVGFNVTRVSGDTLTLAGGETLELASFTSVVGFVGAALAKTSIAEDGGSATTTFISGNYYQDFGGDRTALFDFDGDGLNPETVLVDSIGGFGELSLGVNYVKILDGGTSAGAKQLNASLRADARFGDNVSDAYSVTAQVRLSF